MRVFSPYYVGARLLADGLPIPAGRVLVVNEGGLQGRIAEAVFRTTGYSGRLFRKAQALQPALVHAHFGIDAISALTLVEFLQIPFVITFHGYDATVTDAVARRSSRGQRMYLKHRAELWRRGTLFIAVSEFIRSKLLEQGFPHDKIVVHYIGIDRDRFHQNRNCSREPVVLFVGRLVEKKGCEYLIRAMQKVQRVMPSAMLVIIGDGPLRESLERLASQLLRQYKFLGWQSPDLVKDWMSHATVFSVPSVTALSGDAEGFGLVFAEAQAAGLPVASFASGGVPEAVANGQSGFLVPEKDIHGLADSIIRLLSDSELWDRFSASGIERVARHFDLYSQTRQLELIYDQLICQ